MATTTHQLPELHDHAGVRWLAPMTMVMIIVTGFIIAVMIYPFVT